MTSPITNAVLKSGIISPTVLEEFRRWKTPVEIPDNAGEFPLLRIEDAAMAIEEALQSEGYTITRETDLEVLHQYLTTQEQSTLHVEIFHPDPTLETEADIEITYGRTTLGEFIIPWRSESIANEITNGLCFLHVEGNRVYFKDVRELFFGDHKAFMVCSARENVSEDLPVMKRMTGGSDGSGQSS